MSRNRPDYRARAPFGTASQAPFYCATTSPRSSRPSGRGTDRPQSLFCLCPRFWQIPAGNSQRSRASGAPQPACPAPVYRPFPLTTHGCSGPASPRPPARSAHRRAVRPALPSRAQTDAGTLTAWPKFSNGIRRLCHRAERAHLSPRRGRRGTERLCGCVTTEFRRGGSDTACLYSASDVACGCGEMPQATLTKRPECQALPPRAERHRGSVLPLGAPFVLGGSDGENKWRRGGTIYEAVDGGGGSGALVRAVARIPGSPSTIERHTASPNAVSPKGERSGGTTLDFLLPRRINQFLPIRRRVLARQASSAVPKPALEGRESRAGFPPFHQPGSFPAPRLHAAGSPA
jgi:hypothetical protein